MSLVYLASPYSHPEEKWRLFRFQAACRAAAKLMRDGYTVFCPIAHSHPIAMELPGKLVMDHEFWMRQDLPILECCERLFVLRMDGWESSKGMAREIDFAAKNGIPIEYMEPV